MIFPAQGNGPYRLLRALGGAPVAAFEESLDKPEKTQGKRLSLIAGQVAGSVFGREAGLTGREDFTAWREAIPIRTYAELAPWLDRVDAGEPEVLTERAVDQLVQTSGTTGKPKRVPVTPAWAASVAGAQRLWVLGLLRDDEGLAGGSALSIVSPAFVTRSVGGLPVGSNTGRMFLEQPFWVRWRAPVPYSVYCIEDVQTRQYAILRHALAADVRSWTAANPSTILLYTRRLREWWEELCRDLRDGTLGRTGAKGLPRRALGSEPAWPWDLRRVNCWKGGPAAFFVEKLPAALGRDVPIREVGITASEGYFAVPVDDGDPVAWLAGHLLEFVDERGREHWAWEVEAGREYRLVVSTEAGLCRYDLGDIVRVTGFAGRAPRLVFVRRAGAELSAVGERVTEAQLQAVATRVCPGVQAVAACIRWAEVPRLRVVLGVSERGGRVDPGQFDAELRRENMEYDDRRETGRYGPPEVTLLPAVAWERWKAARVAAGAPEAQVKDPVVVDEARFEELVRLGER
ncbi:hypothetical protein LBMAG42_22930 [Deltaproteobacteria bacterium]|nr:hypothetical protein LBMAG42_22930 [Deltaproteobacteria bacterium]